MSKTAAPLLWHQSNGLRIWRSPASDFYSDEVDLAPQVYTDAVFAEIAAAGFNAVWLRGKLRMLMESTVFPQLNDNGAARRRECLQQIIERGKRHGVDVFLYFNEPLAIAENDPFWRDHPELKGERSRNFDESQDVFAMCTSMPAVRQFMSDAIGSVFKDAVGLGGVILITASEYHTHCWSHHAVRGLNDGVREAATTPLGCERCRDRGPASIVGELVALWRDAAAACALRPRVLCWNWSWSMWYPDPQAEVYAALPDGVEVLLDFERGMQVQRRGRLFDVDEYALSVVGPSERYLKSREVVLRRGLPLHAKLQLGTTHEIATVPNLPLIEQLHGKLVQLTNLETAGLMGTWNFGCSLTLNTAAVKQYIKCPDRYMDRDTFLSELSHDYFGVTDVAITSRAWRQFGEAFEHYPFAINLLYWSIVNEAPAYPLRLQYENKPMGGSWLDHEYGDCLDTSFPAGLFAIDVADAFDALADKWDDGLKDYEVVLEPACEDVDMCRRRVEELACARMIGVQMRSSANIYRFHAWRQARIASLGLRPPCEVALDDAGRALLRRELEVSRAAVTLCRHDARLGFHQEAQAIFYDADSILRKCEQLEKMLSRRRN